MDALTQVFEVLRLKPMFIHRLRLAAPWGMVLSSRQGAGFHLVEAGEAWLRLADRVFVLQAGDLVVVTDMDAYALLDAPDGRALPLRDLLARRDANGVATLASSAGETRAVLLCGEFQTEQPAALPLFANLPPVIYIPNEAGAVINWLTQPLQMVAFEMQHEYPGRATVLSHLMDVLFIMVVRYWIHTQSGDTGGWLGALYHPQIGMALAALHNQPDQPWTVETLAARVHLSRAAFAAKFTALVGEPPMQYLTRWRMQLGAALLTRDPYTTLDVVALQVGYASAYAFSKAFKRWFGVAPGEYRRGVVVALKA